MFVIAKLHDRTRATRTRALLAGAAVLAVAAAALGWVAAHPSRAVAARAPIAPSVDAGEPAMALVFVSGAVVHPGLYRLSPNARIADAIAAAGGLAPDADQGRLPDLAATIHEGKQVNVPFRKTPTRVSASRLDINTATVEELAAIPTMPYGLAEAIVDYRTQFGAFRSMSELRTMLGLDGPTVTGLRPYLYVALVTP
jgi:competence protein ComEA